jgi:Ca2+-binding RTX toxin-like protein
MPTIAAPATGIVVNSNFTVAADETYVSAPPPDPGGGIFRIENTIHGSDVFLNLGQIISTGAFGASAFQCHNGDGVIDNRGSVIVTARGGTGWGVYSTNWSPDIANSGLWQVSASNLAYGVATWTSFGRLNNSGDWIVSGNAGAWGAHFLNPNSVVNSGDITVTSSNGVATGLEISRFDNETILNTGTILASGAAGSFGIKVSGVLTHLATTAPNIVNEGTITADVAIYGFNDQFFPPPPKVEWVLNTGTINGIIDLGLGNDVLDNRGVINGEVYMYSGNDRIDTTNGVINGVVFLEDGADEFRGGAQGQLAYGGSGDDLIVGGAGSDEFYGENGIDWLTGGSGDDFLSGGGEADVLEGGAGDDAIVGGAGNDWLEGGEGFDVALYFNATSGVTISLAVAGGQATGGAGTDTLIGIEDLIGSVYADRLTGDAEANFLAGGLGSDILDGGSGHDTAVFDFKVSQARIFGYGGVIAVIGPGGAELDRAIAMEDLLFTDDVLEVSSIPQFRALDYIAGQSDLISTFGTNAQAGFDHFLNYGFSEGRAADGFDGYQYVASYADLISALGADEDAAVNHFIANGHAEGRVRDSFDAMSYIASNADLLAAFGGNERAAAQHYIAYGFSEGRQRDTFDELRYIAGYDDLISAIGANSAAATAHWVNNGFGEGRSATLFDAAQYIAGYADLITALGTDLAAGAAHFVANGFAEGRVRDGFDAQQYLANYADLAAAFGTDEHAAAMHFIAFGYAEGRTYHAPLAPADPGPEFIAKKDGDASEILPGLAGEDSLILLNDRFVGMGLDGRFVRILPVPDMQLFGVADPPAASPLADAAAMPDFAPDIADGLLASGGIKLDWRPTILGFQEWAISLA